MDTYRELADRLNRRCGLDHCFSPAEIQVLVYGLALDRGLESDLRGAVADARAEMVAKRAAGKVV